MRSFIRRVAHSGRRVRVALAVAILAGLTSVVATVPSAKAATSTTGYWLVGTDGGIFSFGGAKFFGSTGAIKLNQPIVGMAATPDGKGYWMVASDGGIFAFGSAAFYGSMGGKPLNQPIVGIAATRTGKGYWLVASDGGIFAFGDAGFFGSTGAIKLNKPIVDIVPTPSGRGYWMAASDGGIFAFGDAGFFGSTGAIKLAKRIQQIAATPSGLGYWLVAGDGGVFSFGDAAYYGSAADGSAEKRVVDIAATATGKGYYITASNGAVYAYGDAKSFGSAESLKLTHGVIAMVALTSSDPPVTADDILTVDEDGVGAIDVLANDRDPDGGQLSIVSVSQAGRGGTVSFTGGTVTYKPAPDFNGNDSFSYTVTNSRGATAVAQVAVKVRAVDDLPRTVDDTVTVPLGQSITIDVLGNDSGLGDGLTALTIQVQPHNGTATVSPDLHSIVYTPNHRGSDTLRYRIVDTDGDNNESVVKITVTGADLAPHAVDVTMTCPPSNCEADVLKAGATLGDNGQISLVGEDSNGNVAANGGTFSRQGSKISFAPADGFNGVAETRYQIIDDNGGTPPSQTVDALVRVFYGVPTAHSTTGDSVAANTPRPDYQLSGDDPQQEGVTFWIDGVTGPDGLPNAAMTYFDFASKPNGAFDFLGGPAGTWVVTFHVVDGHNVSSNTATFTFSVNP